MKEIKLTMGQVAFVDDDDFEKVSMFKWHCQKKLRRGLYFYYALTNIRYNGGITAIRMHNMIIGYGSPGLMVDHINGNTLMNIKSNLRFVTNIQNNQNRAKTNKTCSSLYKGVHFSGRKYRADIYVNTKRITLGYFDNEIDAAYSYNFAAIKYFGEYARLNIIPRRGQFELKFEPNS